LEELIEAEGPFDGVLGYSGGAALAAEIIIRDAVAHPFKLPDERPFRFAVFINGASPLRCFRLEDEELQEEGIDSRAMLAEAESMFLRPSALRRKDGVSEEDQVDHGAMLALLRGLKGRKLQDGTPFVTDGEFGLCRYQVLNGEPLIDMPTLHVRSPIEEDEHHGLHLLGLCDPGQAREFHHGYGHDFPRGRTEMKKLAQLIREVAESS
jgi:hypothetical protein